jgi:hypothetical protein
VNKCENACVSDSLIAMSRGNPYEDTSLSSASR